MLRLDDIGFGNLKIWQETEAFCYGIDAVILSDFAAERINAEKPSNKSVNNGKYRICDLGTGNGIIPLILSHKTGVEEIWGLDIQEFNIALANKTSAENMLEERLNFKVQDILKIDENFEKESFDTITCNPPYTEVGKGIINNFGAKVIARHEIKGKLEDFISCANYLLKKGGSLFMVHRPSRLVDIFQIGRKYNLEPKECRFVCPKQGEAANLVLLKMVKGGGHEIKIFPNLYIRNENSGFSKEIIKIYER